MLTKNLDVTYTIVWSLMLAHVIGALICLSGLSGSKWLACISTVRPEILLPIVLSLVFVATFEGTHDWGDLFTLMIFGVVGWLMKRLGWPRPPMVLGIVIGGIFERYLYISTSLYGAGWLLRPVVLCILVLVAWALFRPFAEIVRSVVAELRQVGSHKLRISASAVFTVAIIVFIITAILLSNDWPAAAKPVPLTACYVALTAETLNLVNELFGKEQAVVAGVDGGVATGAHAGTDLGMPDAAVRRGALIYFLWLGGLMALVALIGFIPAIVVFIFVYMHFGFKEPAGARPSMHSRRRCCAGACSTSCLRWHGRNRYWAMPFRRCAPALVSSDGSKNMTGFAMPAPRDCRPASRLGGSGGRPLQAEGFSVGSPEIGAPALKIVEEAQATELSRPLSKSSRRQRAMARFKEDLGQELTNRAIIVIEFTSTMVFQESRPKTVHEIDSRIQHGLLG
jgi:hypothetical protein